jgi:hypothetical protein
MSDDDYVEGSADSAPADAPGAIPADDDSPRDAKQGGIDSASTHDAPIQRLPRKTERTQQARKAFAEAVLASKKEGAIAAPVKPAEVDEFDPEAPVVAKPAALAAAGDAAAAKAAGAEAKPATPATAVAIPAIAAPPAPSLDPEVRQLIAHLKAEREKFDGERGEWEKQRKAAEPAAAALPDTHSLEAYIDSPPRAYRDWLESMRGEKFATDDEFRGEVSDFVTLLSAEVLGVPLPESIRVRLDATQAKKIVRTHRTIQTRREAAAAAQLEKDRATATEREQVEQVEQEWGKAASALAEQFAPIADAEGKLAVAAAAKAYPWLAAEDEPGKIIVDVIRAAVTKDGTQLSWQEASQRANDYLADHAKKYYDKRRPLLAAAPVAPAPAPIVAKPAPAATPTPKQTPPQAPNKWSRDRHVESTKAAFRAMIAGKTE